MANRSNYYPRTLRLQSWEVQRGIISFGEDEYPLQFLGSEANSSNTWLWAWKNINGFDENIISLAREIKAKGEKLNLEALTTAEIEITDELNGHILSIVACGLADKKYCYYRGPIQVELFLLLLMVLTKEYLHLLMQKTLQIL